MHDPPWKPCYDCQMVLDKPCLLISGSSSSTTQMPFQQQHPMFFAACLPPNPPPPSSRHRSNLPYPEGLKTHPPTLACTSTSSNPWMSVGTHVRSQHTRHHYTYIRTHSIFATCEHPTATQRTYARASNQLHTNQHRSLSHSAS